MFDIEDELKKLPDLPGVYIMHDKNDTIIYIGKAISLKKRVRQYFRKNNKTKRIENMVVLVKYFEYIVTDNEQEALILECNLIKENRPKFNVLLKDDKTYPYIKINVKSDYPDIYITRRKINDGAKYFGPYPSSSSAREMVDFIKSKFKIRQCRSFKYKDRACLNYHIKKCLAPCMGYISIEEYKKQIDEVVSLLDGKTDNILKQIGYEIKEASDNLEFEKAAFLRDKLLAIEQVSKKQKVANITENDIDVIGIARNSLKVCIEIFFVRNSKMVERKHFFFRDLNDETDSEIISNFLKQYYFDSEIFPNKIMIKENIEEKEVIENILIKLAKRKIEIKTPQKGEKLKLVEMAENNAKITLENKVKDYNDILNELKEILNLDKIPEKIECYDISNISGTNTVAAMCVMVNGEVKKSLSRTFKIKTVHGQDDPKSMNEVILRRLKHSIDFFNDKSSNGFGTIPDIIFVDGGITQIKAAISAVNAINEELIANNQKTLNIPIYGMIKTDKHKTKGLINEDREEFKISIELLNHITYFQDTVHNTTISYHKKLRDKDITKSSLDNIVGIGEKKKKDLLKSFGSVEKIKDAKIEEILNIKGINEDLAKKIKKQLNKM